MRLLLVEDDAMIGEALRAGLKRDGFVVDWVHDARTPRRCCAPSRSSCCCSTWACRERRADAAQVAARARGMTLPVLIITARDAVSDRVRGSTPAPMTT